MNHDKRFWTESESHHDLAKQYLSGIQYTYPDDYKCDLGIGGHCPFCRTKITYVEYYGERV